MKQASDSLAGPVHFVDMTGLSLHEVGVEAQATLWSWSGFATAFRVSPSRPVEPGDGTSCGLSSNVTCP